MNKRLKAYITSARLRTLPLAASGIVLGYLLAVGDGNSSILIFAFALLTALSLQILSNYANELGDLQKGTDNEERVGPKRSVQLGLLSATDIKKMIVAFIVISIIFGLLLIWFTFKTLFSLPALVMLLLGGLAVFASIKYTLGSNAYGYKGWGDFFVFIFFGLLSVGGVYFLQTEIFNFYILFPASAIGFLCVAMLNVNNMRDEKNDRNYRKRTMVVRMGLNKARQYHLTLILSAFLLITIYMALMNRGLKSYLYLLTLPIFIFHLITVFKEDNQLLDKQMKIIGISTFLFAILSGIGYL